VVNSSALSFRTRALRGACRSQTNESDHIAKILASSQESLYIRTTALLYAKNRWRKLFEKQNSSETSPVSAADSMAASTPLSAQRKTDVYIFFVERLNASKSSRTVSNRVKIELEERAN
jgi:hypothetical protein